MLLRYHGGGTDNEIRVSTKANCGEREITPLLPWIEPRPHDDESGALPAELVPSQTVSNV